MNNSNWGDFLDTQDKIIITVLLLNFILIGTYSAAVSIPQKEINLSNSINGSLNDANATLNQTDKSTTAEVKQNNTDSIDSSTGSSQRSYRSRHTGSYYGNTNSQENTNYQPSIDQTDNSQTNSPDNSATQT